jgi:hypothetical protein
LENIQFESAAKYGKSTTQIPIEKKIFSEIRSAYNKLSPKDIAASGVVSFPKKTLNVLGELPPPPAEIVLNEPFMQPPKPVSAKEAGRNLIPATRRLGAALGTEAASIGGMALRGAGRLAGPVGVAMTAYDLAQSFPAPAPISEEDMGKALRSYRTGPQPAY